MSFFSGFKKNKDNSGINTKEQLNKASAVLEKSLSDGPLSSSSAPLGEEHTFKQTCPVCGATIVHTGRQLYEVSNNNQSAKKKFLDEGRKCFMSHCPKCGLDVLFAYPVQYIDTEEKLNIYLMPVGHPEENEFFDNIFRYDTRPGFTTRLVADVDALVDKIRVFEVGLDDRVVEICKVLKWGDLCEEKPKYANAVCYSQWFLPSENDKEHVNYLAYGYEINGKTDSIIIELSSDFYEGVKKFFASTFYNMKLGLFEEVNKAWAYEAIDCLKQQKK